MSVTRVSRVKQKGKRLHRTNLMVLEGRKTRDNDCPDGPDINTLIIRNQCASRITCQIYQRILL
jgi:hypothetical protein